MKRCPQCNRVETDEALKFCRVDGVTLVSDSSSLNSEAGTAALGSQAGTSEVHTSILPQNASANVNRATAPTTMLPQPAPGTTSELSKPKSRRTTIMIAVLVTAVIAAGSAVLVNSCRSRNSANSIQSIAVMPFVNESGNADLEYLSDGMTETLINGLSQLPNLSVKARSTVFHYKGKGATPQQVGTELSVQAVLSGRVTQHADELTLSLELVDARTGDQIWGEQYSRKANDLVALQNQVARDVANSLRTKLSTVNEQKLTKQYTANPEAYKLYLQGVFYWNQLNSPKAVEYFQQAITVDPHYALAYSGLGDSYLLQVVLPPREQTAANADEALSKARQAAAKALELDRDLPDAHGLMALLLLTQDHDFAGYEREINRAIELNPNYAEGHRRNGLRLFYLGQFEAALAEYRKALDLDPLSNLNNYNYAQTFIYAGRYDEAETQIQKNLKMDPRFTLYHVQLSNLYRLRGNYSAAVEESAKVSEQQNQPESARLKRESFAKGGWPGYLRALITELEQNKTNPYTLATAYAELGEKEKAFAALEDVYNVHSNLVGYFKIDPLLNPLRDDPRFKALLKKSGFPE